MSLPSFPATKQNVDMRNTRGLFLLLAVLPCLVHCGKPTQAPGAPVTPPQAPVTSTQAKEKLWSTFTEGPWKLVASTDPSITGLDGDNFLLYTFRNDFSGYVQVIRNNSLLETPMALFRFSLPPLEGTSGPMLLSWADLPTEPLALPSFGAPQRYTFAWGSRLVLTAEDSGYTYELIAQEPTASPGN
jgi:hypothetical protein